MKLIKLNEACERLTVSRRTLDRLVSAGELTVVRVSPGRYAIDEDEVTRYIAAKTITGAPVRLAKPRISISTDDAAVRLMELLSTRKAERAAAKKKAKN